MAVANTIPQYCKQLDPHKDRPRTPVCAGKPMQGSKRRQGEVEQRGLSADKANAPFPQKASTCQNSPIGYSEHYIATWEVTVDWAVELSLYDPVS